MIRALFLRLIHYVIALGEFGFGVLKFIPQYVSQFAKKDHAAKIEADAKCLRKLPLHIGLVLVENDFSLRDLANIIVWSVTLGISHVSIYDANGEIKRSSQNLQEAVEHCKKDMTHGDNDQHEIKIFSHNQNYTEKLGVGRGTKKANVHLLSTEDGCQLLAHVARQLSHQVAAHALLASDICPNKVSDCVEESYPFPEPDLVLKFGPTHSLLGYLPWQTRLTEIISVPSHRGLKYQGFLSSLHTYARTQQRFGQ